MERRSCVEKSLVINFLAAPILKFAKVAMPRGSRPGERRGGRQRGTPNKKTLLKNAAVGAAAVDPNITPLAFLLRLMRDDSLPLATRIDIAATAAPLFHAKPKPAKGDQS